MLVGPHRDEETQDCPKLVRALEPTERVQRVHGFDSAANAYSFWMP
jgi:hypothetical protein